MITGGRSHDHRFDLMTSDELVICELPVTGGALSESIYNTVRSGGRIEIIETDDVTIDWLTQRIAVTYVLHADDGDVEYPRGVYLPSTPARKADGRVVTLDVELYDKLQILTDAAVAETYTIASGTVVTEAVRDIIELAGETKVSVTPSDETLPSDMSFEPGSTYLQIINALLGAINYFSLWADGDGYYRADPYTAPGSRPVAATFDDAALGLYLPDVTYTYDNFAVPNHVVRVASTADDELTAEATNDDADSPYSTVSRGRTITDYELVEATSQDALDAIAARALAEASQVARTVDVRYPFQAVALNDVVELRNAQLGVSARFAVIRQDSDLDTGALVSGVWREVT